MGPRARHPRFYFDDGNVIFLVEETLFNVYRYFLKRESPVFRDMLSMHSDEGQSDDKPIVLEDTATVDFEQMLRCLFPEVIGEVDDMRAAEWSRVLDFATKWQLDAVRKLAISHMQSIQTSSPTLALQIATARRHNLIQWYWGAFLKLCERGPPISLEEGEQLGMEDTVRISAIRQKMHYETYYVLERDPFAFFGAPPRKNRSLYDTLGDTEINYDQKKAIRQELSLVLPELPEIITDTYINNSDTDKNKVPASTTPSLMPVSRSLYS